MKNMDQEMEQMEQKMDQHMEQRMVAMFMQTLNEKPPKSDNVTEGTHGNKGSVHLEQPSTNKHMLGEFNSNIGANHGWIPKGIHFLMVELRKFDGIYVFIWVD